MTSTARSSWARGRCLAYILEQLEREGRIHLNDAYGCRILYERYMLASSTLLPIASC